MVIYYSANFIFHTYETKFFGLDLKVVRQDRKVDNAGIEKWVAEKKKFD